MDLKYLVDLWKRLITHTRRMICLIQNMQKEDPFGLLCSFSIRNSKKSYSQGSLNMNYMNYSCSVMSFSFLSFAYISMQFICRAMNINGLIGYIGGYIGLFVGYSILQVPDTILNLKGKS